MIEWIVSSSVLIGIVLAVRTLGKSRLSCRARYALWLLVLMRLLVPVQLFTSNVNMEQITARTELAQNLKVLDGVGEVWYADGGVVEGAERYDYMVDRPVTVMEQVTPERYERIRTTLAWRDVLLPAWRIGSAAMGAVLLVSNLRFTVGLKRRRVPFDTTECDMETYVAEGLTSPCLVGVFRPAVYLTPEATRDERTLRHVLAHETTHKLHGDCLWSLLRLAVLCLHWYNPLVWLAVIISKRDGELACDEATLARLGEDERTAYGETLLSLVRAKPNTRELLSASTAMTAGKKPMRERIETIAKHPRTKAVALLLAVTVLLTATVFAFSKGEQPKPGDVSEQDTETDAETPRDGYASVEDYVDSVRAQMTTATYYTADGEEKTANVLDTRINYVAKDGELSGLAPDGTLELYSYLIETKLDVALTDVALVGGMYTTEDGWCDLEGQGGHSLVVLRRADGSVDVLFDRPNNDDRGGLYYFEESTEELLYDFYVKENGLDLPLYTVDLVDYMAESGIASCPAHRADGDGWYLYVPIQAWYRTDVDGVTRFGSLYDTGSVFSVTFVTDEEREQLRQYAEGREETYYPCGNDTGYLLVTQYDPSIMLRSDMTGLEPSVLKAMRDSFVLTANTAPGDAETLRAFAQTLYDEQPDVTLTLFDDGARGSYKGGGTPNAYHVCYELINAAYSSSDKSELPANGRYVRLEALGCTLAVNGNNVYFRDRDGVARGFRAVCNYDYMEDVLRLWYDEAELRGLGGDYAGQGELVIPDRGQGYLAAAQEHCDKLSAVNLHLTHGSSFCYTWVKCVVEAAEEQTENFRKAGRIDENTWAIFMTEVFVPENEKARNLGMAGNTLSYDEYVRDYGGEYDASVPEGAYIRWQCGYVTKGTDGYHTELVGTGW